MTMVNENKGAFLREGSSQTLVLLALNALYVGFGAVIGTVQGGLPPVLRQQGHDIGTVGWIYAFYLPFGLAFLWAHYIDRLRLPFLGRRTGWIVGMQGIAIATILLAAFAAQWPVAWLVALGFAVTFTMATMDTALDALAVETVAPGNRPLASGLKLAALALGAMIGNGAFVVSFSRYGWTVTFLFLAGLLAVLTLPLLIAGERQDETGKVATTDKASLLRVLRDGSRRNRLLLVMLVSCVIFPLAGLNRIMLVDAGVPLERIGWVMGTLGPISMLAVSLVAVPLMARAGVAAAFLLFGFLAILAVGLLSLASLQTWPSLAVAASIVTGAAVSGIYVALMAKILGWAAGAQPATDYAAYYGASRLASTLLTIAAAQLAARLDWAVFYAFGAILLIAVILFANVRIFRSET